MSKKIENVKVQALKAKVQHMTASKVYEVSPAMAEVLIKNKKAVLASDNMEVGKMYAGKDFK